MTSQPELLLVGDATRTDVGELVARQPFSEPVPPVDGEPEAADRIPALEDSWEMDLSPEAKGLFAWKSFGPVVGVFVAAAAAFLLLLGIQRRRRKDSAGSATLQEPVGAADEK